MWFNSDLEFIFFPPLKETVFWFLEKNEGEESIQHTHMHQGKVLSAETEAGT